MNPMVQQACPRHPVKPRKSRTAIARATSNRRAPGDASELINYIFRSYTNIGREGHRKTTCRMLDGSCRVGRTEPAFAPFGRLPRASVLSAQSHFFEKASWIAFNLPSVEFILAAVELPSHSTMETS